jgi:hypothetical protein
VDTSPIADELSALEQARSRLEAALASDENWRALTQPGRDDDSAEARVARHARNTRLEMALAGNALYQAWKHVNGAIDALRTRSVVQVQAAEPLVRPAAADKAGPESGDGDLPDDVAALLRDAAPEDMPHGEHHDDDTDEPIAAAGGPSPTARAGLVQRLERLEEEAPATEGESSAGPDVEANPSVQGEAPKQERKGQPGPADPPEATVTFVVREHRAPLLPSAELPPDLGTQRNSALFDRLRSLEEPTAPPAETYSPSKDSGEEAEVTIVSVEGLRQRREAEERDDIVRRFRKALSGD